MISNIDGDILVYSVGAACEGKRYHYKGETFESKSILNKVLKDDGVDDSCITEESIPESWESTRKSVVSYLEDILTHLDTEYQVHISGVGNFRYEAATILPYKGNRTNLSRPFHYDAIRQFLVDAYGARVSINKEADDAIGLAHDPEEDIIATLDKDLNCIPGLHYNWISKSCKYITEVEADRHFYCQVLTGDRTDNIPGLYGVGNKSKLLLDICEMTDSTKMHNFVVEEYKKRFGSYYKLFFEENCKLLWILQRRKPVYEI